MLGRRTRHHRGGIVRQSRSFARGGLTLDPRRSRSRCRQGGLGSGRGCCTPCGASSTPAWCEESGENCATGCAESQENRAADTARDAPPRPLKRGAHGLTRTYESESEDYHGTSQILDRVLGRLGGRTRYRRCGIIRRSRSFAGDAARRGITLGPHRSRSGDGQNGLDSGRASCRTQNCPACNAPPLTERVVQGLTHTFEAKLSQSLLGWGGALAVRGRPGLLGRAAAGQGDGWRGPGR